MESFACKDLGLDCDYTVAAATRAELMEKVMEHGGSAHADLMEGMTADAMAAFRTQLEAAIRPA